MPATCSCPIPANSVVVSVRRWGESKSFADLLAITGIGCKATCVCSPAATRSKTSVPPKAVAWCKHPAVAIVDLRLSTMPTLHGADVAIRLFDPRTRCPRSLDQLGMDAFELEIMDQLLARPSGLILFVGPVASGKSTSLYAMIERLE